MTSTIRNRIILLFILLLIAVAGVVALAQRSSSNPFPPIDTDRDVLVLNYAEFARIPNAGSQAPRLMHMLTESGTQRLFVSTMVGKLYAMGFDGSNVVEYLDMVQVGDVGVMSAGRERGLQSFAFHPQFGERGTPGYGKLYTWSDVREGATAADFSHPSGNRTHDTVLHEWTANDPYAARYDGGAPREVLRVAQPYSNHNAGQAAFNPLAMPGDAEFGLLYLGSADGGSGGDPQNVGQNLGNAFGKILRIDPLGNNSGNAQYGIPTGNPFASDSADNILGEIYAYGVRNPQRFGWDAADGRMLVADIGQNQVEEISPVTAGANLGWNRWEASFRHDNRSIVTANPRGESGLTWPVVEYDHDDPLWIGRAAVSGVVVVRGDGIPALRNKLVFADIPSGELLYVPADTSGPDSHAAIRRILLNDGGTARNLLQLIREKNGEQGQDAAQRADLRFGLGPNGEIFLLNKADGVIRQLQ